MRVSTDEPPSARVLVEFGLSGRAEPLAGGQRTTWRVGPAVLKRADLTETAMQWQAELLHSIDGNSAFRVSPPLQARDGRWIVSGWSGWRWERGRRLQGEWQRIVEVGSHLHAAVAAAPSPAWLRTRTDVWAVADRVAWAEVPVDEYLGVGHLAVLVDAIRPVNAHGAQLIHGDLTGNVLFDEHLPPLVLDLSPYWRPTAYASAIVVADALVFENAPQSVVALLSDAPAGAQYLLRAMVFRIVAEHLSGRWVDDDGDRYSAPVAIALRFALTR